MMQQEEKADKSPHPMLDFSNLTHETLAGYLLQSKDPKVQSAAKRIFSIASEDETSATCYENTVPEKTESSSECQSSPVSDLLSTMASAAAVADKASGHSSNVSSPSFTIKSQAFPAQTTIESQRSGCTIADLIACTSAEKNSGYDKVQRRERNRMHARKTRQRKKEHMANLQQRAEELKREQVRLRQIINEQNTATILLVMFGQNSSSPSNTKDTSSENDTPMSSINGSDESILNEEPVSNEVDALLRRPVSEIPDATKVPDLPALVYPIGRMPGEMGVAPPPPPPILPDDGIDYELLSKDRTKCSPEELDLIRKERNRMHAKRTRDRKRLFMEEMETIIKTLESENRILAEHHQSLKRKKGRHTFPPCSISTSSTVVSSTGASLCGDNEHDKEHHSACESTVSQTLCDSTQPPSKKQFIGVTQRGNERKVSDVDAVGLKFEPSTASSSNSIIRASLV